METLLQLGPKSCGHPGSFVAAVKSPGEEACELADSPWIAGGAPTLAAGLANPYIQLARTPLAKSDRPIAPIATLFEGNMAAADPLGDQIDRRHAPVSRISRL
jgi:hypothetical protein